MKLVALISGGKDSIYNIMQCVALRHEVVAVANIEPYNNEELNSYMYQSVGHEVITLIGTALGVPVYRFKTQGRAICQEKSYVSTNNDEVEDLLTLLTKVKQEKKIGGVAVGAIASDYQRTRVENVCLRLGLKCFAYLWKRDQIELLQEMIDAGIEAIIIKVASIGLNPLEHLGKTIKDIQPYLLELHEKYGVNVCGEGGEYETLTINCPLFIRPILITSSKNIVLSNDAFAPVGILSVTECALSEKTINESHSSLLGQPNNFKYIHSIVRDPDSFIDDCVNEIVNVIFSKTHVRQSTEVLPFPFHNKLTCEPEINRTPSAIDRYWKSDTIRDPAVNFMQSKSLSSVSTDLMTYNLNYSTGWCCFGNVTGGNLMEALNNLQKNIEKVNFSFEDIVIMYIYVRDVMTLKDFNAVYSHFVSIRNPPARVWAKTILPPGVGALIMSVAQKRISKAQELMQAGNPTIKETLHVQSISHWIPAACGIYSHCVKVGDLYYLAGQIPLIPGSMEILNRPILYQCKLTLRHVLRVLKTMNENFNFSNIFQGVCYVISQEIAYDIYNIWSYLTEVNHATITVVVVQGLQDKADLQWEVVACNDNDPLVEHESKCLDQLSIYIKRCMYSKASVCSLLCKVNNLRQPQKTHATLTVETVSNILVQCVNFLKRGFKESVSMCMLRVFYIRSYPNISAILEQSMDNIRNKKVVVTLVPVLDCENPGVFMTVSGICS